MTRILITLLTTLALVSPSAWSLGLGTLLSKSALNQPFAGEIPLYDVKADELDTVRARLASADEFTKAGVPRPHFLTELRFTAKTDDKGQPILLVSSREPIREPFLDFLVEVIWPQGRMVREYTILLDPPRAESAVLPPPPVTAAADTAPAVTPAVATTAAAVAAGAVTAAVATATPAAAPAASAPAPATPTEAVATTAVPEALPTMTAKEASKALKGVKFPIKYGPIKTGTGLWRIASTMSPKGVTIPQTALALYRNNPKAFANGKINRLVTGRSVTIPSAFELLALDAATADRQFKAAIAGETVRNTPFDEDMVVSAAESKKKSELAKTAAVAAATGVVAAAATAAVLAETDQTPSTAIAPTAAVTDTPPTAEPTAPAASAPASTAPAAAPGATPADNPEAAEMQRRIQELESQLSQIGTTLDEQTTASSATPPSADTAPAATEPVTPAKSPAVMPPPPAPTTAATPAADGIPLWVWAVVGGVVVALLGGLGYFGYRRAKAKRAASVALPEIVLDDLALAAPTGLELAEPVVTAVPPPPVVPTLAKAPAAPEVDFNITLTVPPLEVGPDGKMPALPAAFAKPTTAPVTPPPAPAPVAAPPPPLVVPPVTPAPVMAAPPPAAVDVTSKQQEALGQAELFLSYGRYPEAQLVLQRAIEALPTAVALKYKLAEVYARAGDTPQLLQLIGSMMAAGDDRADPAAWARVMGLLSTPAAPAPVVATPISVTPPPVVTAPVTPPSVAPALGVAAVAAAVGAVAVAAAAPAAPVPSAPPIPEPPPPPYHEPDSGDDVTRTLTGLDFDPADDWGVPPSPEPAPPPVSTRMAALDAADLARSSPDTNVSLPVEEWDKSLAAAGTGDEDDPFAALLDNLTAAEPEQLAAGASPAVEPVDIPDLAADLEKLMAEIEAAPAPTPTAAANRLELELESDHDGSPPPLLGAFATPASGAAAPPTNVFETEVPLGPDSGASDVLSSQWQMDSGLWDEVATKLDLAIAYVEMDDPNAARVILEEVAREGNNEQRNEANALLAKLPAAEK